MVLDPLMFLPQNKLPFYDGILKKKKLMTTLCVLGGPHQVYRSISWKEGIAEHKT